MKPRSSNLTLRKIAYLTLALVLLIPFTLKPAAHAQLPSQQEFAQQLAVTLVSLTSPVWAGNNATIMVNTTARANCQIRVLYKSDPSTAQGLVSKSADKQGGVRWIWKVNSRTPRGDWPITVTCTRGDRTGTLVTSFVVR